MRGINFNSVSRFTCSSVSYNVSNWRPAFHYGKINWVDEHVTVNSSIKYGNFEQLLAFPLWYFKSAGNNRFIYCMFLSLTRDCFMLNILLTIRASKMPAHDQITNLSNSINSLSSLFSQMLFTNWNNQYPKLKLSYYSLIKRIQRDEHS